MIGACGAGAGAAAGADAAPALPPPPIPPIIIIIIIICMGSLWLLFCDSDWIDWVICVIIAVSWSLPDERAVTRDAPPPTLARTAGSMDWKGSRAWDLDFDMGFVAFPTLAGLGGEVGCLGYEHVMCQAILDELLRTCVDPAG